jgi:2-keto-4-pentenoate hydratase/2-oxohepta-3-ene-1,7-dioic acid hydratase in catechol pathway
MTYVKLDGMRVEAGKLVCLLRSYRAHAEEMGSAVSEKPEFFLKPRTAIIHGGQEILVPPGSREVHHEVELAVIMGRHGSRIPPERAMEHVMGYAVMIDVTARDIQAAAKKAGKPWAVSKGYDTFAPISDAVSASRVTDPHDLGIWLKVNGQFKQRSSTRMLIYTIPEMISFISGIMTLEPGDIIATGTPEGVGPLVPGDEVEAGVDGVGVVKVRVARS